MGALGAAVCPVDRVQAGIREHAPLRVLFVGNSYTRFNLLPVIVRRLAASNPEVRPLRVQAVTRAGYTLRMHWKDGAARRAIMRGRFDRVVLQAHSLDPVTRRAEFEAYAARFGDLVRAAGGELVLYETWARDEGNRVYREQPGIPGPDAMQQRVADAYRHVADALGARIAPVGFAWRAAKRSEPGLALHKPDGSHPSWSGTYLAALVLYGSLTGADPVEAEYRPHPVPRAEAELLRRAARTALVRSGASDLHVPGNTLAHSPIGAPAAP